MRLLRPLPAASASHEPAAPPKSIELGQTKDQVVAIWTAVENRKGWRQGDLFYKDLKVTFVGGKVTGRPITQIF